MYHYQGELHELAEHYIGTVLYAGLYTKLE